MDIFHGRHPHQLFPSPLQVNFVECNTAWFLLLLEQYFHFFSSNFGACHLTFTDICCRRWGCGWTLCSWAMPAESSHQEPAMSQFRWDWPSGLGIKTS